MQAHLKTIFARSFFRFGAVRSLDIEKRIKKPPEPGQIKLISLDLDGTLLRSDKSVGEWTLSTLQAAHRQGVRIVLNSGRMIPSMEPKAALLGLDVYLIGYNGAVVKGLESERRRSLFECTLPLDVAMELVALARTRKLQLNYYRDNLIYSEDHPERRAYIDLYRTRTGSPYRIVEAMEDFFDKAPYKVLFVTAPKIRDALEEELSPIYSTRSNITKTEPEYLEFLHPQVNKATGLEGLCTALGLNLQTEVLSIGDAYNDVQMLQESAWGVAMQNAYPEVFAFADWITSGDCDTDGVAEAIERWVLRRS